MKTREEFSCGTLVTKLVIVSAAQPLSNTVLDTARTLLNELLNAEVILRASKLVEGDGRALIDGVRQYSTVRQDVSYDVHGYHVSVSARLTVRGADLDDKLAQILAHALVNTHNLPTAIQSLVKKEAAAKAREEHSMETLLNAMMNPFGGDLPGFRVFSGSDLLDFIGDKRG